MVAGNFSTYCRITDYIEAEDADLARIIRGLCADMALTSLKGKTGITFLMPKDKAFREKLEKLSYSNKPEDGNKASDMIHACIIRDVFKKPEDWMTKKDDIPNSLLPHQRVEVESADKKEVVFKSGARAVLDEKFEAASRKPNLTIWKLTGEIPVTTDMPASLKYARKKKGVSVTGGSVDYVSDIRQKICMFVENKYSASRIYRDERQMDPFMQHVFSLFNYIANVAQQEQLLLNRVLPVITLCKADFYLLVEPYKVGNYLIDDGLLSDWWAYENKYSFSYKQLIKQFTSLLESGSGAMVYTDRASVVNEQDMVRTTIREAANGNRARFCVRDVLLPFYKTLESSNTINGVGPIFPESLRAYYASNPNYLMVCDELRYASFNAFELFEKEPVFDRHEFVRIVNMISGYQNASTPEERLTSLKILNCNNPIYHMTPGDLLVEVKNFVNSTFLLYIPLTTSECANYPIKNTTKRGGSDNTVRNVSKLIYYGHSQGSERNTSEIDSMVNKMTPDELEYLKKIINVQK